LVVGGGWDWQTRANVKLVEAVLIAAILLAPVN